MQAAAVAGTQNQKVPKIKKNKKRFSIVGTIAGLKAHSNSDFCFSLMSSSAVTAAGGKFVQI